ncbi:MAG TPA: hypothetical protein VGK19_18375 [Capsulimonadaceae bacterium]|jgi:hypothetical protein
MKTPEGFPIVRLMMVLSSMAPLFVLVALRGSQVVPDLWLTPFCFIMIAAPLATLLNRIRVAQNIEDEKEITIRNATDHREYLLVYLFTMLVPLYQADYSTARSVWAAAIAFVFIVFIFYHMNLHYMNIAFAICQYRVYTIDSDKEKDGVPFILLSRDHAFQNEQKITAYRISNTVYIQKYEKEKPT